MKSNEDNGPCAWKVPVSRELLNARTNNLYVAGFDDYVITEMINMLCNEQ